MQTLFVLACGLCAGACALGALHPNFDDNLAQRCGMAGTALACTGMAYSQSCTPNTALLVVGLACYAAGTVFKLWRHS